MPSEVEKRCGAGDLWVLGNHRLLCGDATKADDVARVFGGETPLLCVTDPPYGVEYDRAWRLDPNLKFHGGGSSLGVVANDSRSDWRDAWAISPSDVLYAWSASGNEGVTQAVGIRESAYLIRSMLVWRKPTTVLSR